MVFIFSTNHYTFNMKNKPRRHWHSKAIHLYFTKDTNQVITGSTFSGKQFLYFDVIGLFFDPTRL